MKQILIIATLIKIRRFLLMYKMKNIYIKLRPRRFSALSSDFLSFLGGTLQIRSISRPDGNVHMKMVHFLYSVLVVVFAK